MHEIEDERPIPVGRARATAAPPETYAPPAPAPAPRLAAHIERTRPQADEPDGRHPLAALRGFRMEVELVEAAFPDWRRVLVRSLVAYVLVIGSILGLIAAFLVLTGHAGSGHP
jgi:hypothetical protein